MHRISANSPTRERDSLQNNRVSPTNHDARCKSQATVFDLTEQLQRLQDNGHTILVMLDANATLADDKGLQAMVATCQCN
jgi:hypothetical protein